MSHDIRTPMNGILGMTQIAMNHLNDPAYSGLSSEDRRFFQTPS